MITALFIAFLFGIIYVTFGAVLALFMESRPIFSHWLENWYFALLMIYLWPAMVPLILILVSINRKKANDGWDDRQGFI